VTRTVTISDKLAELIEERRRRDGHPSLDAAVEALAALGLFANDDADHSAGYTDEELRALIAEAEASGPAEPWDPAKVRAEVRRRYAERQRLKA
jgi:hypothetical protein